VLVNQQTIHQQKSSSTATARKPCHADEKEDDAPPPQSIKSGGSDEVIVLPGKKETAFVVTRSSASTAAVVDCKTSRSILLPLLLYISRLRVLLEMTMLMVIAVKVKEVSTIWQAGSRIPRRRIPRMATIGLSALLLLYGLVVVKVGGGEGDATSQSGDEQDVAPPIVTSTTPDVSSSSMSTTTKTSSQKRSLLAVRLPAEVSSLSLLRANSVQYRPGAMAVAGIRGRPQGDYDDDDDDSDDDESSVRSSSSGRNAVENKNNLHHHHTATSASDIICRPMLMPFLRHMTWSKIHVVVVVAVVVMHNNNNDNNMTTAMVANTITTHTMEDNLRLKLEGPGSVIIKKGDDTATGGNTTENILMARMGLWSLQNCCRFDGSEDEDKGVYAVSLQLRNIERPSAYKDAVA
jgi:hypothetical protein